MPEDDKGSFLQKQIKEKPNIEDVIPEYLDGDMRKPALDFVTWLRENKMPPTFAGITNAWRYSCKGKCLYYIRLSVTYRREPKKWVVNPHLFNIAKYEDVIKKEGLSEFLWDNVHHCQRCFPEKYPEGRPCVPGRNITLLGKEVREVCSGRQPLWFHEPGGPAIECIKRLLELERAARN